MPRKRTAAAKAAFHANLALNASWSLTNASGKKAEAFQMFNLGDTLSTLASIYAGQDIDIQKASLQVIMHATRMFGGNVVLPRVRLVVVAHEATYTDATESAKSEVSGILDDAIAGDFQYIELETISCNDSPQWYYNGTQTNQVFRSKLRSIDLTKLLRQVRESFASPVDEEVLIRLIGIGFSSDDGNSVYLDGWLDIDYLTKPKETRKLLPS